MSKVTTEKVVAYITQGDKLLVFSHPHHPGAGIQVPAGTIKAGEAPEEAVLREAYEETGLDKLKLRAFLGMREYDLANAASACWPSLAATSDTIRRALATPP
jgi:8-oxo-dGTP pyrophosphatase MutT (NUDIX family)